MYRVGDKVKIINKDEISAGEDLTNGKVYDVVGTIDNDIYVIDDASDPLVIYGTELMYLQKVVDENNVVY